MIDNKIDLLEDYDFRILNSLIHGVSMMITNETKIYTSKEESVKWMINTFKTLHRIQFSEVGMQFFDRGSKI